MADSGDHKKLPSTDLVARKQALARRLQALETRSQSPARPRAGRQRASRTAFLLIDCSSSMRGEKLTEAKSGAMGFAREAKGYRVGIIAFATHAHLVAEPLDDLAVLREKLDGLRASGSTHLVEAINLAAEQFASPCMRGAVVVVTDGMPDHVGAALKAAQKLKDRGVEVITIGTGDADVDFLKKLASRPRLAVPVAEKQLASGIVSAARLLPGRR